MCIYVICLLFLFFIKLELAHKKGGILHYNVTFHKIWDLRHSRKMIFFFIFVATLFLFYRSNVAQFTI